MRPITTSSVALAAAAGLHLAAFPQHVEEGTAVAGFFLGTAVAQLAAAASIRPGMSPRLRWAIVAGNVGLIVLWALSRSFGVEPAGVLDVLAVAAEAVVVVGLLARPVSAGLSSRAVPWPAVAMTALVVFGAALTWAPATHGHDTREAPVAHTHSHGFKH